jgi:hypothetical protein
MSMTSPVSTVSEKITGDADAQFRQARRAQRGEFAAGREHAHTEQAADQGGITEPLLGAPGHGQQRETIALVSV